MKNNFSISLIQSEIIWERVEDNREHFGKLIMACPDGTDLIILPEMFSTGFSMNAQQIAEKYSENMPTIKWMKEASARKNACICGSVSVSENEEYYNRLIWVQPNGLIFTYDKRHLFSFAGEQNHYKNGNKRLIVEWQGWKICPLICYDLRFPVWSRNALTENGADYDLLIYVANWPEIRRSPWEKLLYARAIENQAYLAGVNRVGADGNGHSYSGDSVILNPRGEVVNSAMKGEEKIISASLSMSELVDFRSKFPVLSDADTFRINCD
jgi:omega-amidase